MSTTESLRVCVFCGASTGDSSVYVKAAHDLGRRLGAGGHRLIYGAGGIGLMGAVARGASKHGARIVGVIPAFLRAREMKDELPPQEIIITTDLARRKSTMMYLADGFIGLPGGYGTLDEILEVLSMNALGLQKRPVVLLNTDGFWNIFVDLIDELTRRKFLPAYKHFAIVDSAAQAVKYIERAAKADFLANQRRPIRRIDVQDDTVTQLPSGQQADTLSAAII